MGAASPDRVRTVLSPAVAALGLDLDSLSVTSAGRRRLLRVVVDRDGGITLDDVAEVSRRVSEALDASDVMGGQAYVLEVTSPGVDRPLTEPRHWRRATGRLVRATLTGGGEVTGRVLTTEAEGVVLDVPGGDRRLDYADVARAVVQVEFSRTAAGDPEGPATAEDEPDEDGG